MQILTQLIVSSLGNNMCSIDLQISKSKSSPQLASERTLKCLAVITGVWLLISYVQSLSVISMMEMIERNSNQLLEKSSTHSFSIQRCTTPEFSV